MLKLENNAHLSLSDGLRKLYVSRFHSDFSCRLDFLPNVDIGIITSSYLNDDQVYFKSAKLFNERSCLYFEI